MFEFQMRDIDDVDGSEQHIIVMIIRLAGIGDGSGTNSTTFGYGSGA
jgi:hypothetical protein